MGQPTNSRKRTTAVTPRKTATKPKVASSRKPARPNASILNFFQKAEKEDEGLFVGQHARPATMTLANPEDLEQQLSDEDDAADVDTRYNESGASFKRQRLSGDNDRQHQVSSEHGDAEQSMAELQSAKRPPVKRKGPFVDDSDSDEEDDRTKDGRTSPLSFITTLRSVQPAPSIDTPESASKEVKALDGRDNSCPPPLLNKDESVDSAFANVDDFADLDDFPDDEEFGGEEYRMMQFMQEQARLEADMGIDASESNDVVPDNSMVANCPICDGDLGGITPDEATRHVNACLDGNPLPVLAQRTPPGTEKTAKVQNSPLPTTVDAPEMSKRFARAAVPRPGQANPFESKSGTDDKPNSAFAQLMSGHAESAAWATAAAAEHASRGKPAYERTCPFYKIMPNFYICVDAFRYGAVKGCNAYFLSHFHSDHYIGLTGSWAHGPIYCSKVTAELCKMQLRVPDKWVVPLEFEKTVEVPGTEGVVVTMIPANHCPGSSLFLFEKTLGKAPNTRKQRILHCGDFRACPAHIAHPLLKPDVQEAITGKTRQQKIDICYLDTTYLNPRYSFPPQEDVIQSCAELCASISPDPNAADDAWDRMTRKSGPASVSKYFTPLKQAPSEDKPAQGPPAVEPSAPPAADFFANVKNKRPPACRQRLLVICGTYSIGKERICIAIAKALKTKIFASPAKIRICSKLGDPELTSLMTSDPLEAQVHMQMLMEIRAETLRDYLDSYRPHFSRIIGFRPSGWNYRPSTGNGSGHGAGGVGSGVVAGGAAVSANANTPPSAVPTTSILHSGAWASRFRVQHMAPQRGSTKDAMCFGVPYSEHSSFRELAMFVMALRIERVVPTVNVGSEASRKRMKGWVDRWLTERRKGGLVEPLIEGDEHGNREAPTSRVTLWDGKDGQGGGAWW